MTSEICVMNRIAVVLAADSATTVTHWSEKGKEERYFKGANKIFQLSNCYPVGLMIFDSADLLKVPWEVIVKIFRAELGNKSFNELSGFANEFLSFLSSNTRLFPVSVQKEVFLSAARSAGLRLLFRVSRDSRSDEEYRQEVDNLLRSRQIEVDNISLPESIDRENVDMITLSSMDELRSMFLEWQQPFNLTFPSDMDQFIRLSIIEAIKTPQDFMGTTGMVFAGFGDHDIFPSMLEFKSCGIVMGSHVYHEVSKMAIDHETPAWLSAFAQTSMSDTFSLGVSEDVYGSVMQAVTEGLESFGRELCECIGKKEEDVNVLPEIVRRNRSKIGDLILQRANQQHALPLRRVLGALPVDEMAGLAETLINLQSLKEKVTKPSETVGGPVDVAAITRGEGMVWIKRKHYFDPNLNPRFMQRVTASAK